MRLPSSIRYVAPLVLAAALLVAVAPSVSAGVRPAATAAARPAAATAAKHPSLLLVGKITKRLPWKKLLTNRIWNGKTYVAPDGPIPTDLQGLYRGETMSQVIGLVDDNDPKTFNVALAKKGYTIHLVASDGYTWDFKSKSIIGQKKWIIAKLKNGKPLPAAEAPYRDVGSFIHHFYGRPSVFHLIKIELIF